MAKARYDASARRKEEIEKEAQKIAEERCKPREEQNEAERKKLEEDRKALEEDKKALEKVREELSEREEQIKHSEKEIEERKKQASAEARKEIEDNEESIRKDFFDKKNDEAEKKAAQTILEANEEANRRIAEGQKKADEVVKSKIEDLNNREHNAEVREEEARRSQSKAEEAERKAREAQKKYEDDTLQALIAERLKRDEEIANLKKVLNSKINEYQKLKADVESDRLDLEEENAYVQQLKERYMKGSPETVERLQKEKEDLKKKCTELENENANLWIEADSISHKLNNNNLTELQKEVDAGKQRIKSLQSELEQYPGHEEVSRLKQDSADLARIKEENRVLYDEKIKLESQLAAAASISRELDGARLEAQALRVLNDQMKEKLRYFSEAYDTVKEDKFAGLIQIDSEVVARKKTRNQVLPANITLEAIIKHIRNYAAYAAPGKNPLFYDEETIRIFIASLAASHDSSRLLLLQGLSGTGKSSLPRIVAEALGFEWNQVSVQPSWRDNRELLGYDNDFTHRFKETEFTKILYRASTDPSKVNIVVLDEVNLARIEYYFADFLSELEKPTGEWKVPLISNYQRQGEDAPKYLDYQSGTASLVIGKNVWFVGTANNDDSTATITDKVYDRAQIIDMDHRASEFEINKPIQALNISYESLKQLFDKAWNDTNIELGKTEEDNINLIDGCLQEMDITFGNRIKTQLKRFVPVYMAAGGKRNDAIDFYLAHKILRRLDERYDIYLADKLDELEKDIDGIFQGSSFIETRKKIKTLKRKNFNRGEDR